VTKQLDNLLTGLGIKVGVDLRVGHFEANAQVPDGGIKCNIPVSKTPSTTNVTAGSAVHRDPARRQPVRLHDQDLNFEDKISQTGGVKYNVTNTAPNADAGSTDSDINWTVSVRSLLVDTRTSL